MAVRSKKAVSKKNVARKPAKKKQIKKKVHFIPKGFHTLTPYLSVHDGKAAVEFYEKAFGAKERKGRMSDEKGKIMHTEIKIGVSHFMLSDEFPEYGNVSPKTVGKSPVQLMIYVPNVDILFEKAIAAGATVVMAVEDQFYGDRSGRLLDPFGYQWHIATHMENVSPKEMARRAAKLYGAQAS
ncbi:MAG TPA: VOC family protein [bacterium]|nr:VOC family protein [bacterium]HMZ03988.1 VOC family protein [bacterium]HNB10912.1 VOC family protein [bacterium]HNB56861.1 VOC family protein [bacterium]HND77477.1 VOC family protein [bacterium]